MQFNSKTQLLLYIKSEKDIKKIFIIKTLEIRFIFLNK